MAWLGWQGEDLQEAVSLCSWQSEVEDPKENKEKGWGDFKTSWTSQFTTITATEEQYGNCKKGFNTEDNNWEGKGSLFDWKTTGTCFIAGPVECSKCPCNTNTKEDVNSIWTSDVSDWGIGSIITNSSALWSECVLIRKLWLITHNYSNTHREQRYPKQRMKWQWRHQ